MDKPFSITGPTVVVGAAAVLLSPNYPASSYRVRNLSTSTQYFTTGQSTVVSLTPAAGTPAVNTIGMLGSSVETFASLLPYMIASTATGFEVTPGDGV